MFVFHSRQDNPKPSRMDGIANCACVVMSTSDRFAMQEGRLWVGIGRRRLAALGQLQTVVLRPSFAGKQPLRSRPALWPSYDAHAVAVTPDHPSFPSVHASQAVLRYCRPRVEAVDLQSLLVTAKM
jgi:hypothetical protein